MGGSVNGGSSLKGLTWEGSMGDLGLLYTAPLKGI